MADTPDLEKLYTALKNADAAGDAEAAKRIATYINSLPAVGASRRSPMEAMDVDPTSGMNAWQRFVAGYGRVGSRAVKGTGKLARDVLELVPGRSTPSLSSLVTGQQKPGYGTRAANALGLPTAESLAESERLDEPLRRTTAGTVGDVIGNIALAVPSAFAPGANTVAGAGLYGALYGAIQPAEGWRERGSNTMISGVLSGGLTAAARAIPAAYRAFVSPFIEAGQEDIALSTVGRFAKDPAVVKNAMSRELVPGSRPSLAEVTGDPGIAQLQRAAQARSTEIANLFADAKTARLQARKDALLSIAGSHDDRAFFEAARDATAQRLYGEAFKEPLDAAKAKALAPDIKELLARPSIQQARTEALRLAKEEGEVLKPADLRGGSVKGMHYMKRALDDQIGAAKRSGDNNLARLLMGTKGKLVGVIQEISPKYASAMAEYQAASKPISTMDIGSYLYDKLIPAASDVGAERMTAAQFVKAVKEGDEMAKKATGFKGAKLADILSSDQIELVVNVAKDLGREIGAVERARVPGSPTAQYLAGANMMRQIIGPLGLPKSWVEKTIGETLASWGTKFPFNVAEERIQGKLGEMLVNPQTATNAMSRQAQSFSARVPVNAMARFALPPAAIGSANAYVANPDVIGAR